MVVDVLALFALILAICDLVACIVSARYKAQGGHVLLQIAVILLALAVLLGAGGLVSA